MLTTLSITSLDQGRALAHWNVDRLYAEPADATAETQPDDIVEVAPAAAKTARRSWLARLRAILETGYPFAPRQA